jgi:hypothetical protein
MDNAQGGHELLHLQTNCVVKRRKLTKIPITLHIIKQVHALAVLDKMPYGLKITNRANRVIFDSAWIAGVDYDEEQFEDEEYEEEDTEVDEEEEDYEEYDEMDVNELADILQEPNESNKSEAPQEPENPEIEHEIIFEEDNTEEEQELFEDYGDEAYEPESEEDISLEADDEDGEEEDNQGMRRTGRVRVPPQSWQHLQAREEQTKEYSSDSARIIAMTMFHYNTALAGMSDLDAYSFLQTYSLKQGLKKFGKRGEAAASKEMMQLHNRVVFTPISVKEMSPLERKRAMESLIFLNEKRDQSIKARMCANGSTQRAYITLKYEKLKHVQLLTQ